MIGRKNEFTIFQIAMGVSSPTVQWHLILVYLDHTINTSEIPDEHINHARQVLHLLYRAAQTSGRKMASSLYYKFRREYSTRPAQCPQAKLDYKKTKWEYAMTSWGREDKGPRKHLMSTAAWKRTIPLQNYSFFSLTSKSVCTIPFRVSI